MGTLSPPRGFGHKHARMKSKEVAHHAGPPLVAVILRGRPHDRLIIGGIDQYAREHGDWTLYIEEDPEQKLPDMNRWHGQGIIANFDDRRVATAIRGLSLPVVGVGGGYGWYDPRSGIPYIHTDNDAIGRLGAEHLIGCGFANLAFCGYPESATSGWSAERAASFQATAADRGRACHVFAGRVGAARRWEDMQAEIRDWLARLPKPVGLMACNDVRARHVLEACRGIGLRVPHDVAVIGVDNDEMLCELAAPPLSSVHQSARRIGYEAAAVLDRLMQGAPVRERRIVVPPIGVVARASTDTLATDDEEVVQVLQTLRRNPWRCPRIDDLAEQVGVSRSTLEHRFRDAVGRTIHDEHVRIRLAATRKLIVDTDLTLKAVAQRAKFPSQQYMTTFVRRHTGFTPARLRAVERQR